MQATSATLATAATATTAGVAYAGGKSVLVLDASEYGTTVSLQCLSPSGTWITMNGTTFSANQVTAFDCPQGMYRIFVSGGTTTALNATLVRIPYG